MTSVWWVLGWGDQVLSCILPREDIEGLQIRNLSDKPRTGVKQIVFLKINGLVNSGNPLF